MSKPPRKRNRRSSQRSGRPADSMTRRRKTWSLEQLEQRHMMAADFNIVTQVVDQAFARASNLSQYTSQQLNSAEQWIIRTKNGVTEAQIEAMTGFNFNKLNPGPANIFTLSSQGKTPGQIIDKLSKISAIEYFYPEVPLDLVKKAIPNDPLFPQQWYLQNTGQLVSQPDVFNTYATWGEDIRAVEAWDVATGKGVVIAIVDDGVLLSHPDLGAWGTPNWDPSKANIALGFDFSSSDLYPFPDVNNGDYHGTAVAGIAAGDGNNGIGITGVAYDATLVGIRLLSSPAKFTDQNTYLALTHNNALIDIYNHSWGPADIRQLGGLGPLGAQAIIDAVFMGRPGANGRPLGNILVIAAGNGGEDSDNSNFDSFANSIWTIAVGAVQHNGTATTFTEPGANILVVAPSGDDPSGLVTTDLFGDLGYNQTGIFNDPIGRDFLEDIDYTSRFSGTSASAPVVSGVVALMLEAAANNGIELTYRDVQYILAKSARTNDPLEPGWFAGGGYFRNPLGEPILTPDGVRFRPVEPHDTSGWVYDGTNVVPPGMGQGPGEPLGVTPAPDVDPSYLNFPFSADGLQDTFFLNAPPPRWTNGAGYTVHGNNDFAYGHGVVDAAMAVQLAANWNSWLSRGTQVETTVSSVSMPFDSVSGLIPAAEITLAGLVPGGIGGRSGFADYFDEFFNLDPPGPPPDGPFNDIDDMPVNSRGSVIPFTLPRTLEIEQIELTVDIDLDPDEAEHLRIALMSPDGTITEFNNWVGPNQDLPSFLPPEAGGNLTWTFTTTRHLGEKGTHEMVDLNPNSFFYGLAVVDRPWMLIIENYSLSADATINSFTVNAYGKTVAPGRIQGFVGIDVDNSGDVLFPDNPMYMPGGPDQVLAGVTVWLDVDNDGVRDANEPWQITGADGNYYFDVPFNTAQRPTWQVGIEVPAGFEGLGTGVTDVIISTPVALGTNVDLAIADDVARGVHFSLVAQSLTVSGTAFADVDQNGNSTGDPRLGGRVIYIDLNENGEFDDPNDPFEPTPDTLFAITDPVTGEWSITANLTPGYYTIAIAPENGMIPSSPASGFYRIYLRPGDNITGLDFGTNPSEGLVSGYVFLDSDGDGMQDPGETPISGFSVFVDYDNDGKLDFDEPVFQSTAAGGFVFQDLLFNQYAVRILHQPGWVVTTPDVLNIEISPGSAVGGLVFGVRNTASHDYGDLPSSYGSASHGLFPGFYLGAGVDGENSSAFSPDASGDNMQGIPDEDGVLNANSVLIEANQTFVLNIEASPQSFGLLFLQGWIDYNNDGDFNDEGEHLQFLDPVTGLPLKGNDGNGRQIPLLSNVTQVMVRAPANVNGTQLAARFRYGEAAYQGVSRFNKPTGAFVFGEVEDYYLAAHQSSATQTPDLPGDFDGNNVVDIGDYELWKSTFGSTTILFADGNQDGVVDNRDFVIWRNNLGKVAGAGLAGAIVFEEPIVDAFAGAPTSPELTSLLTARGATLHSGVVDGEMAYWYSLPAGPGAVLGAGQVAAGQVGEGFFVMPQQLANEAPILAGMDVEIMPVANSASALDLAFDLVEEDEELAMHEFDWDDDQDEEHEALELALEQVFG